MDFVRGMQKCADLSCGYENGKIGFRHKAYDNRSERERSRYDNLRKHLQKNGMLNPIITWNGHVLIGQRRFEIMRETHAEIDCLEIDDDLDTWGHPQVTHLVQLVQRMYREMGKRRGYHPPETL